MVDQNTKTDKQERPNKDEIRYQAIERILSAIPPSG